MMTNYVYEKIDGVLNQIPFYMIQKREWNIIKKDILILYMIIERRVNVGILAKIIFNNINQKNKTILQKYNIQSDVKLNLEELRVLKKYIIEN